jgi:hypothetical protein
MLSWIVLFGALAVVWRLGYWPFDRSYTYLKKYGEPRQQNVSQSRSNPGE